LLKLLSLVRRLEAKVGIIQITANRPGAGKTSLIGALIYRLTQQGRKAGYYKPFSSSPSTDGDVTFVSQQLLVEGSPRVPPPQLMPAPSRIGPPIAENISALGAVTDITLVEGPDLTTSDGVTWLPGDDPAVVPDSRVVLVLRYEKGLDAGAAEILAGPIRERLIGVVVNHLPIHRHLEIAARLIRPLRKMGLPVLGAIPEDRFMLSVTVQQIFEHLNGNWVQEPRNTDAHVDRFLIGGNIMDSGPSYFGRHANQAVITRAQRPDIQMASLKCQTRCLILTGGDQPTEYIRVEADKKGVPLISVAGDTISTAEALDGLLDRANPYSLPKLRRFLTLMQEHLDLEALNAALG
jgi:BioD-like phosphotransacetylase family protein